MHQFCEKCGAKIPTKSAFCEQCGHLLHRLDPNDQKSSLSKDKLSTEIKPKIISVYQTSALRSRPHTLLYMIVGLMAIALLYLFFILIPSQQKYAEEQQILLLQQAQEASSTLSILESKLKDAQNDASQAKADAARAAVANKSPNLISIISQWRPSIALIGCSFSNGDISFGSGTLLQFADGINIVTNKHVVETTNDRGITIAATACAAKFQNQDKTYSWKYSEYHTLWNADTALLPFSYPDVYITTHAAQGWKCANASQLGENIVILGYPTNGGSQDITATEGIIASFDGNYYVTSAKVDHGNSGGAAINIKGNCYLGIPTFVQTDIESLARILKWEAWY